MTNAGCCIFIFVQLAEVTAWRNRLLELQEKYNFTFSLEPFEQTRILQIVGACGLGVLSIVCPYFILQLLRQIGWNDYKRIGPDVMIQRLNRNYQYFLMVLKLCAFFQVSFNIFWLVILCQQPNWQATPGKILYTVFQAIFTLINTIVIIWGANAARNEKKGPMFAYVLVNLVLIGNFGYIFSFIDVYWYFWDLAMAMGIVCSSLNIMLAFLVMYGYGNGLKDKLDILSSRTVNDITDDFKNIKIIDDLDVCTDSERFADSESDMPRSETPLAEVIKVGEPEHVAKIGYANEKTLVEECEHTHPAGSE